MSVTYLDAAVAAPVNPVAQQALVSALDEGWADPRRLHTQGRHARMLLEGAREAMAAELGARTEEVTFTGSYENAVQAAVLGVRQARRRTGSVVVTSAIEHSAVLHAAEFGGVPDRPNSVQTGVDRLGRSEPAAFTSALRKPGVALACLQAANAEVGTLQPVDEVAGAAHQAGVPVLMDATAAAGHVDLPPAWDILVADPRSWGAPGGLGVLVVRAGTRWTAPGPPDDGLEAVAGTPSVPLALAAAVALRQANEARAGQDAYRRGLLQRIRDVARSIPDTEVAGDLSSGLPHVLTFSSLYVDGEAVVTELDRLGFAVGSGSACTASTLRPSHVLDAMGLLTHGNVRIGLPMGVQADQVERFCDVLPGAIASVRSMLGADEL